MENYPKRINTNMKKKIHITLLKKNDLVCGKYKRKVINVEIDDNNINHTLYIIHMKDIKNGYYSYFKVSGMDNMPNEITILKREFNNSFNEYWQTKTVSYDK